MFFRFSSALYIVFESAKLLLLLFVLFGFCRPLSFTLETLRSEDLESIHRLRTSHCTQPPASRLVQDKTC